MVVFIDFMSYLFVELKIQSKILDLTKGYAKDKCKSWRKINYVNLKKIKRQYKITCLVFKEIKSIKTTVLFISYKKF